jgi:hypothetical protein
MHLGDERVGEVAGGHVAQILLAVAKCRQQVEQQRGAAQLDKVALQQLHHHYQRVPPHVALRVPQAHFDLVHYRVHQRRVSVKYIWKTCKMFGKMGDFGLLNKICKTAC